MAVVTCLLSFIFLTLALKKLDAGIANALWVGACTVLVAIAGLYVFKSNSTLRSVVLLRYCGWIGRFTTG